MPDSEYTKEDFHDMAQLDNEAKFNLLGFFSLLLEVDKRNHPENYKKQPEDHD